MFNRRDPESSNATNDRTTAPTPSSSKPSGAGFIGPSTRIEGSVVGDEDLLVEGEIRGRVELKSNKLTIGPQGRVFADVHAKQVCVEGQVDGHLIVQDQLEILSTARIKGTITAPRVSLKDGARFNGTIDMDPDAKALRSVFDPSAKGPPESAPPESAPTGSESKAKSGDSGSAT